MVLLLLLLTESPPTITAAIVLSPHSIRITWSPPTATALITGYTIVWMWNNDKKSFANSTTVTNTTTTYVIDGLEEFVTYDITVNAIFSDTPGPLSDVATLRTLSDSKYK